MCKKLCALLLMLLPICSYAIPVRWDLQEVIVTVGFGGINPNSLLTGSFIYDADTNLFSDIDLVSPNGSGVICPSFPCTQAMATVVPFPSEHYDTAIATSPITSATGLVAVDGSKLNGIIDGDTLLILHFVQALTNAGGTVAMAPGGNEYFCKDLACLTVDNTPLRSILQPIGPFHPHVVGTAVPEPRTLALFVLGLVALLFVRRPKLS